jgi:hypothetical protein
MKRLHKSSGYRFTRRTSSHEKINRFRISSWICRIDWFVCSGHKLYQQHDHQQAQEASQKKQN